ncbi:hypothetical protein GTQ99_20690 [Kineococcus sp. T13]|uniref:hypothetical protein n=1 Tax=Kineococcus vitellinus TaxID=2696565 RepID=UPI001412639D|nr:hypothetical protein [Kineococcus vitellinus]NAZ77807.1 hypothetical protein [Kineococcus vitellinus]
MRKRTTSAAPIGDPVAVPARGRARGPRRRTVLGVALAALVGAAGPELGASPAVAAPPPFLGLVGPGAEDASSLAGAGLNAVVVQAAWDRAQPTAGAPLDRAHVAELRARIAEHRARGLSVVLDLGLQYTPAWVFRIPGARFVDQYGNAWSADVASGEEVADAVWNPRIRAAQASYVAALARALGRASTYAVRVGGLLTGELRLPGDVSGGAPVGSWWAFSPGAQASSPVPGHRPGVSAASPTADGLFLRHYLSSVVDYQDFLVRTVAGAFDGDLQLMYPSYGVRPGDEAAAVAVGLRRRASRYSELVQGVDFARLVQRVGVYRSHDARRRHVVYSTWLDGPEFGTSDRDASPVAYLARLARAVGAPVGGENTASSASDERALRRCQERARALGLAGLMWFHAPAGAAGSRIVAQLATTFR